jgi:hypothetical protein
MSLAIRLFDFKLGVNPRFYLPDFTEAKHKPSGTDFRHVIDLRSPARLSSSEEDDPTARQSRQGLAQCFGAKFRQTRLTL